MMSNCPSISAATTEMDFTDWVSVYRNEGVRCLFNGATTATARAVLVTIGQLSMYDQYKYLLLKHMDAIF